MKGFEDIADVVGRDNLVVEIVVGGQRDTVLDGDAPERGHQLATLALAQDQSHTTAAGVTRLTSETTGRV